MVEDSPDEEMLVMRGVRRSGLPCQILVAHSTDEGLDYLLARGAFSGRRSSNPDVIVTDLRIGSIGGAEFVSEVRANEETRLIPIVVLTGSATTSQVDDLYLRGANSFLEKPSDIDGFSETIRKIVCYWGMLNTVAESDHRAYPL